MTYQASPSGGLCVVDHGDEPATADHGLLCSFHRNKLDLTLHDLLQDFPNFTARIGLDSGNPDVGTMHRKIIDSPAPLNVTVLSELDHRYTAGVVGTIVYWNVTLEEQRQMEHRLSGRDVEVAYRALIRLPRHHNWFADQPYVAQYFGDMSLICSRVKQQETTLTTSERARLIVQKAAEQ